MKSLFKNKFLIIFILFLFLCLFFVSNVFGYYNIIVSYNNDTIDLSKMGSSNNCAYILVYNKNELRYETLHPFGDSCSGNLDSIFYRVLNDDNSVTIYGKDGFRNITVEVFNIEDYTIGSVVLSRYSPNGYTLNLDDYDFVGSNVPIYTDNSCEVLADDFFQVTPLNLTQIMNWEGEKQTIQTTLVGLVKLLIPLLVCLIGFWKAWNLLSRILHNS